jgi:hypothetical protein
MPFTDTLLLYFLHKLTYQQSTKFRKPNLLPSSGDKDLDMYLHCLNLQNQQSQLLGPVTESSSLYRWVCDVTELIVTPYYDLLMEFYLREFGNSVNIQTEPLY